jgi:hypothetical protein
VISSTAGLRRRVQPVPEDDVLRVLGEQAETLLALPQGGLGVPALPPLGRLVQLALDGRGEPGQPVLEHEVAHAGTHHRGRGLLPHLPADQQHRDVRVVPADLLEGLLGAEDRHVVVADHHVGGAPGEGGGEARGGVRALVADPHAGPGELAQDQDRVVVAVIDDQDVHLVHRAHPPRPAGAGWFTSSQYTPSAWTASTNSPKTTGLRTKLLAPSR